jgi:hypothetical protein
MRKAGRVSLYFKGIPFILSCQSSGSLTRADSVALRLVHKHSHPPTFSSTTGKLAPSSVYSSSTTSLVIRAKAPPPPPKKVVTTTKVTEMCFGGGSGRDAVVIRKYEKPRHSYSSHHSHRHSLPREVRTIREEKTVTRRSTSAHRNHDPYRRSGSRIVEETRYR